MTSNPLGIHAGIWGFDWSETAAERAISGAAAAGYSLIEIPAVVVDPETLRYTRELLVKHDMTASVSLALDLASDINSVDATRVAAGEKRLVDAVDFARGIGASFVGGVVFSAMTRYWSKPTADARAHSLAVLRRVGAYAATHNITLGIEYVNRYESNLLNTAEQTRQFIIELGLENAVLHLDTFHAHVEEASLARAVLESARVLGYVHASESHRGRLGTGSVNWDEFFFALSRVAYAGPIVVETFSPDVISEAQAIEIGLWETQWSDPQEIAEASFVFLTQQLSTRAALSGAVSH